MKMHEFWLKTSKIVPERPIYNIPAFRCQTVKLNPMKPEIISVGWGNGSSLNRRQAITWTNVNNEPSIVLCLDVF